MCVRVNYNKNYKKKVCHQTSNVCIHVIVVSINTLSKTVTWL